MDKIKSKLGKLNGGPRFYVERDGQLIRLYERVLIRKIRTHPFEILGMTKTWFGSASKIYPEQIQVDRYGKKSKVTKLNDGAVLLHSEIPQNETYYIVDGKYYTQVYARVLVRHIKL